jgi:chromosome partitioning protein
MVRLSYCVKTKWPEGRMIVLSILARKGGVGKSTAARCIAIEALKAGKSTVLIDSDPQPTCYRWGQRRIAAGIPVPLVVQADPTGLEAQVEGYRARGVDIVIIDTPPTAAPVVNAALDISDAALVITRPNPEDLESVQESLRVAMAQHRPSGVILWQAPPDRRVKAVSLALEALVAMGAKTCPTVISASISYPYAYAEGLTPQEREPDGRARAELADVWAWMQREGLLSNGLGATSSYDHTVGLPKRAKTKKATV